MVSKKIIGLCCGFKNGANEHFIKAAAKGALEFGVETEIIRATDLNVKPCRGCHACGRTHECVIHDDVEWILQKTLVEDAALIVAVSCFHVRTNSYLSIINERMNHVFDKDINILKKTRVGAIIGTGGSGYDGWASLNLLLANIFMQHTRLLVDQMQVNHCRLKEWNLWLQQGSPLTSHTHLARAQDIDYEEIWKLWPQENDPIEFEKKAFRRAEEMGRNVAKAMAMPINQVKYVGEESLTHCPVCHCNVLLVPENLPYVMCPICNVRGTVTQKNNQMKVEWNEKDAKYPRFGPKANLHHSEWLHKNMGVNPRYFELIQGLRKEYTGYGKLVRPESPVKQD